MRSKHFIEASYLRRLGRRKITNAKPQIHIIPQEKSNTSITI